MTWADDRARAVGGQDLPAVAGAAEIEECR